MLYFIACYNFKACYKITLQYAIKQVYSISLLAYTQDADSMWESSLFRAAELSKNAEFGKYNYSWYGIRFQARGRFSSSEGTGFGKNIIIFDADMNSRVYVDNRKKYILILGKESRQVVSDSIFTAEKEYATNFTEQHKKFCLSLHFNGVDSYIFVNGVEIYKFKAKDSEINPGTWCLGNVSKDFSVDNM